MDPSVVVSCKGSLIVLVGSQSSSLLGPASWKGCWLQVSGTVVKWAVCGILRFPRAGTGSLLNRVVIQKILGQLLPTGG